MAIARGDLKILPDRTLLAELKASQAERPPSGCSGYAAPHGMRNTPRRPRLAGSSARSSHPSEKKGGSPWRKPRSALPVRSLCQTRVRSFSPVPLILTDRLGGRYSRPRPKLRLVYSSATPVDDCNSIMLGGYRTTPQFAEPSGATSSLDGRIRNKPAIRAIRQPLAVDLGSTREELPLLQAPGRAGGRTVAKSVMRRGVEDLDPLKHLILVKLYLERLSLSAFGDRKVELSPPAFC